MALRGPAPQGYEPSLLVHHYSGKPAPDGFRPPSHLPAHDSTHAGGVFRRRGKHQEYLLVQATAAPDVWVLPKGHIDQTEPAREGAVREVREETGVWARIVSDLHDVSYRANGQPVRLRFYLMEATSEGKPSDEHRLHAWHAFDDALTNATHAETRELLKLAARHRTSGESDKERRSHADSHFAQA